MLYCGRMQTKPRDVLKSFWHNFAADLKRHHLAEQSQLSATTERAYKTFLPNISVFIWAQTQFGKSNISCQNVTSDEEVKIPPKMMTSFMNSP